LVDILHIDPLVYINFIGLVSDVISNGALSVPFEVSSVSAVALRLNSIVLPKVVLPDVLTWPFASDGKLTARLAFSFLRPRNTIIH